TPAGCAQPPVRASVLAGPGRYRPSRMAVPTAAAPLMSDRLPPTADFLLDTMGSRARRPHQEDVSAIEPYEELPRPGGRYCPTTLGGRWPSRRHGDPDLVGFRRPQRVAGHHVDQGLSGSSAAEQHDVGCARGGEDRTVGAQGAVDVDAEQFNG